MLYISLVSPKPKCRERQSAPPGRPIYQRNNLHSRGESYYAIGTHTLVRMYSLFKPKLSFTSLYILTRTCSFSPRQSLGLNSSKLRLTSKRMEAERSPQHVAFDPFAVRLVFFSSLDVSKYRVRLIVSKCSVPCQKSATRMIVTCHIFVTIFPFLPLLTVDFNVCDFSLFPSPTTYVASVSTQPLQAFLEQIWVTVVLDR